MARDREQGEGAEPRARRRARGLLPLTALLGRGAAGEVWQAVNRRTDETVAAKLLRPEHAEDHELVDPEPGRG